MPEQDWKPAASKLLSSLVKSLHFLCNNQVDFSESIKLVGHIKVRVDHKYKFYYIVDEHVSRECGNTDITFTSNSFYTYPTPGQVNKKCKLDQSTIFTELHQDMQDVSRLEKTNEDCLDQVNHFHAEDISVNREGASINYSVAVGPTDKQTNQAVISSEGEYDSSDCMFLPASLGDFEHVLGGSSEGFHTASSSTSFDETLHGQVGHTQQCQQQSEQGDSCGKDAQLILGKGLKSSVRKHEGTKQLIRKTSPLFSCQEYLDKYNSFYTKMSKHSNKQEMMKIFSDLAQKYSVAITIKPAKFTAQLSPITKMTNESLTTAPEPLLCGVDKLNYNLVESGVAQTGLQCSDKSFVLSRGSKSDNISDQVVGQMATPGAACLSTGSDIFTVVSRDPGSILCGNLLSYSHSSLALVLESEYDIKHSISDNITLSNASVPFPASEISTAADPQTTHKSIAQETPSSDVTQSVKLNGSPLEVSNKSIKSSDYIEPNTPSSALLSALAVALAKENCSATTFSDCVQDYQRQQPIPKRHRGNYLVCLKKKDPEHYERYKCLSKEEQARERRRISDCNRDPCTLEKKGLMNRVLYFRRVNKLPPSLRDKSNDEIRCMPTDDLKKLLPPTKSLKNMDPVAREEWYKLGRSREWRRRKKLLDPEGFKRYNNERAKRYQENLRENNPEKYKELRAKGADRLRQYRFSQRIVKAIKEGREIKSSDSVSTAGKPKRVGWRKNEAVVEVQEADSDLLIEENINRTHYVLPECATTHGEAATGRESSSASSGQLAQPDILDFMYSY